MTFETHDMVLEQDEESSFESDDEQTEDQKRHSLSFVSSFGLVESSSNISVSEAENSNYQQLNIEPN